MRIRAFILADAVAVAGRKAYIHGAGVNAIEASVFPYSHPTLGLFITLARDRDEAAMAVSLVVSVHEQGETEPTEVIIDRELPAQSIDDPDATVVATIAAEVVGLTFPRPGRYAFILSIDGEPLDQMLVDIGTRLAPRKG